MKETVKNPTCMSCPHNLYYNDPVPKHQFGVMMHMGERFCTYGKRARRFRGSDPKIYTPSWCGKRKRDYRVKSP